MSWTVLTDVNVNVGVEILFEALALMDASGVDDIAMSINGTVAIVGHLYNRGIGIGIYPAFVLNHPFEHEEYQFLFSHIVEVAPVSEDGFIHVLFVVNVKVPE